MLLLSSGGSCSGGLSLRLGVLVLGMLSYMMVRVLVVALRPLGLELLLVKVVLHLVLDCVCEDNPGSKTAV